MANIQSQQMLYHLTSLTNAESIFAQGLKPRSQLQGFRDVADHSIVNNRTALRLENYVPFHWFARNPFDGRVQADHPDERFFLIAVNRSFAQRNQWKVVPRHPLAGNMDLMDYQEGFDAIDWEAMDARDYHNPHSKSVCMAECLSPTIVMPGNFSRIFVKNESDFSALSEIQRRHNTGVAMGINERMFS